jgi:hypothetical protein
MNTTTVQLNNEAEMAGFIKANGTACRFVSMVSKTPVVKMRVGNPWHKISKGKVVGDCNLFKVSRKRGLINADYNTSVRNRIAAKLGVSITEVEYTNGETWHTVAEFTKDGKALPLRHHKDETKRTGLLLQYYPHGSENCYVNGKGEIVPDADVEKWLHAPSERSEFKPTTIAVYLSNILRLKASGIIAETDSIEDAEASLQLSASLADEIK